MGTNVINTKDYTLLEDFRMEIELNAWNFSFSFWVYLIDSTTAFPATIINQVEKLPCPLVLLSLTTYILVVLCLGIELNLEFGALSLCEFFVLLMVHQCDFYAFKSRICQPLVFTRSSKGF